MTIQLVSGVFDKVTLSCCEAIANSASTNLLLCRQHQALLQNKRVLNIDSSVLDS